jgi:hypothetical protein
MGNETVPPGDHLRRAMHWLTDEQRARPEATLFDLVGEAGLRFDLSPAQEEWLLLTLRTTRSTPAD